MDAGRQPRHLLAFAALSASYFALIGFFNPYLPLWLKDLGLPIFTISLLTSVQSLTRVFAPYAWGALSDRTGERVKLLRFSAAVATVAALGLFWPGGALWLAFVLLLMFTHTSSMMSLTEAAMAHLVAGDVHLAHTWTGEALQARAEQERSGAGTIEFVLPKEGALIWLDGMAVPARARHPRAAHEFINYCLRPEVAAQNAAAHQYGVPNAAAQRLIDHPVPWPSATELERLEYFTDLGRVMLEWDRAWTEVKAAG